MRGKIILALLAGLYAGGANGEDLLQIFDIATQNDPKLLEAEANRNALLESRPQALAKLLPTFAIIGNLNQSRYDTSRTYTSLQIGLQNFWDSNVNLKLTQPIYHHDYWVQLSQAENQIAQAEAEYGTELQELFTRTAKAYFGVLSAEDVLEFAKAEKRAMERQHEQAEAKYRNGTLAEAERREAQAALDLAAANTISAQRAVAIARAGLGEITGNADLNLARLAANLPLLPPEPNDIKKWSGLAQDNNLTIIAAQNRMEFANKNKELQFAGHLPTLDMVGSVGVADTDRPAGLVANSQVVGLQLNVPLYQGGLVNSKERQAEFQYVSAKQHLDRSRRAVEKQIHEAFYGVEFTMQQIKAQQSAVESTQTAVETAEAGFRVGTRLMVDVITAERNFYRAQKDYAQARYDYIYNSLLLKQTASALTRQDVEIVNTWLEAVTRPNHYEIAETN